MLDNCSEGARVLQLRHPRTGQGASFWYNSGSKTLCEVLRYEEEHRSWFIGDKASTELELQAKVNTKVRIHGEDSYLGLHPVESAYMSLHN